MSDEISKFKQKVANSPALKAILLGETLSTLQRHGVNIHDAGVAKAFGLDKPIDLTKIEAQDSTNIVTITK